MQLINKKHCLSSIGCEAISCGLKNFAHLTHTCCRSVQTFKVSLSLPRYQLRESCLSCSWRTIKNHGSDSVCIQHSPKQLSVTQNVGLAGELRQCRRSHPSGQWLSAFAIVLFCRSKKIHNEGLRERKFADRAENRRPWYVSGPKRS